MERSPSLKRALTVTFILTAVLPIVAIGLSSLYFLRHDLIRSIGASNLAIARSVAGEVEARLRDPANLLRHVAEVAAERRARSRGALGPFLESEMRVSGHFDSLFVLDRRGGVQHAALGRGERAHCEDYLGMDMANLPVYREALQAGEPRWSATFISPASGEPTMTMALPFRDGMVLGNLSLAGLGRIVERARLGAEGAVIIVNRRGRVIAHPDHQLVAQQHNMGNLEIVRRGLAGESGTYRYTFGGVEKFGSAVRIDRTGWVVIVEQDVARTFAPVSRMERIFLGGLLATVCLAVASALLGFGRVLSPVASLVASVRRIAGGRYDFSAPPPSCREVDELAESFALMASAVREREELLRERNEELAMTEEELRQQLDEYQKSQDEIRCLNADLERRVFERTAELESANRELESFSYSVSHDLRAPLRHIDGFSLALLEECAASISREGKEYLSRIRAATGRMGQLIDDLLELSRVSRGAVFREPVDLSRIARSLAAELVEADPERKVSFEIVDNVLADGDVRLLRVVLANLIGNAWKYTRKKEEARIRFGTAGRDGERVIFVSDDGAGFDMRYADNLFGPFQRLHGANEFEGTGIGLATVQRIIHRHGGRVWAEAEVGKGATFYFTLP